MGVGLVARGRPGGGDHQTGVCVDDDLHVYREEFPLLPAVTAAYVSQAVGLFCVAADAVHGPQVVHDGIPLVGRDLAELESDEIAHAEAVDGRFRYTPEGYAGPNDPGVIMRGQLFGQELRSRPLFMVTRDGANTEWDSLPSDPYYHGRPTT